MTPAASSPRPSSVPESTTAPSVTASAPLNSDVGKILSLPTQTVSKNGKTYAKTVLLVGNPNVGKSVFFNAFTGQYVNVSNFPGTTVDIPEGEIDLPELGGLCQLKDTPGVYGLSALSEEETVAESAILGADILINVVSALSLERDLFLTQQIIDYGKPLIVAVNQLDEAKARNLSIDLSLLSRLLDVPVLGTVATTMTGIPEVKQSVAQACMGKRTPDSPSPEDLKALEAHLGRRMQIYGVRRQYVNSVARQVVSQNELNPSLGKQLSRRIGQALLNPAIGMITGLLVLLALYQIIGVWVAGDLVNFTEKQVILAYVTPFLQGLVKQLLPVGSFFYTILAGEFGVITMGIQYIFGVLFPLVMGFYLYISLLEDCGYLPRIAVLSDSVLTRIGLNGRAVIPLILGLGCVTMATVSTRVLTSQRERTIASTLLAITIPCSAQIGVIVGLMALAGGFKAWAIFMTILVTLLLTIGGILNTVLPGKSSGLILDLPPMRLPVLKNIARKTWTRTVIFLKEAAPLFLLGSLMVSILQASGLLITVQAWLAPLTETMLHLPRACADAFVMGMVRRDFGAAGLYFMAKTMTHIQILTSLTVITLFVPCIASATVIWKERGLKESTVVLVSSWLIAFGVGALVTRILEFTRIL